MGKTFLMNLQVQNTLSIYDNEKKTDQYNIYTGCLVVNCTLSKKMYLYDLIDIKKKRVTHSRLPGRQVIQNRFF